MIPDTPLSPKSMGKEEGKRRRRRSRRRSSKRSAEHKRRRSSLTLEQLQSMTERRLSVESATAYNLATSSASYYPVNPIAGAYSPVHLNVEAPAFHYEEVSSVAKPIIIEEEDVDEWTSSEASTEFSSDSSRESSLEPISRRSASKLNVVDSAADLPLFISSSGQKMMILATARNLPEGITFS